VTISPDAQPPVSTSLHVTETSLENTWLRLELDTNGEIALLYDKEHAREIIPPGTTGNQLVTYEDRPLQWDAWDIDPFYQEKPYPVQSILDWRVVETGPLRAAIEITRQVGQSTITQRIAMWYNRRRIDFETLVDWQERQTLLRALFPLDINTDRATCGIQFGALERPTHRNTSWEQARFEVCAHGWVDMSEGGYGVALLNDGKYGHSIRHNVIGVSLLKGPVFPDPDADKREHFFTYSLYPHTDDWRAAQVVRRAYELSMPLYAVGSKEPPRQSGTFSFLSTPTEHIIVETIKVAEDGNGLIVRLYEAHNRRGPACLVFGYPVAAAVETDLLEREIGPVTVEGHEVAFSVRPFEVKTLRVWLQQPSENTLQKAVPEQRAP
jgi:alpha-mannosidase